MQTTKTLWTLIQESKPSASSADIKLGIINLEICSYKWLQFVSESFWRIYQLKKIFKLLSLLQRVAVWIEVRPSVPSLLLAKLKRKMIYWVIVILLEEITSNCNSFNIKQKSHHADRHWLMQQWIPQEDQSDKSLVLGAFRWLQRSCAAVLQCCSSSTISSASFDWEQFVDSPSRQINLRNEI